MQKKLNERIKMSEIGFILREFTELFNDSKLDFERFSEVDDSDYPTEDELIRMPDPISPDSFVYDRWFNLKGFNDLLTKKISEDQQLLIHFNKLLNHFQDDFQYSIRESKDQLLLAIENAKKKYPTNAIPMYYSPFVMSEFKQNQIIDTVEYETFLIHKTLPNDVLGKLQIINALLQLISEKALIVKSVRYIPITNELFILLFILDLNESEVIEDFQQIDFANLPFSCKYIKNDSELSFILDDISLPLRADGLRAKWLKLLLENYPNPVEMSTLQRLYSNTKPIESSVPNAIKKNIEVLGRRLSKVFDNKIRIKVNTKRAVLEIP